VHFITKCALRMCSTCFQDFYFFTSRSNPSRFASCSCLIFLVIPLYYLCMGLLLHKRIMFTLIHRFALGFITYLKKPIKVLTHIKRHSKYFQNIPFIFVIIFVKINVFFVIHSCYLKQYPKIEL